MVKKSTGIVLTGALSYVHYMKRLWALIIDYAIVAGLEIMLIIISAISCKFFNNKSTVDGTFIANYVVAKMFIPFLIIVFIYYSHVFKKEGQTIGEKNMKIKVVPSRGNRITLAGGVLRTVALFSPLVVLMFVKAINNSFRDSVLDCLCGTHIVMQDK